MIDDELASKVLQLYQVENFSMRQIAAYCGMCAKTVSRVIHAEGVPLRRSDHELLITPYRRLIESWFAEHPKLKASQVYERLQGLGFIGSCSTVERATKRASCLPGNRYYVSIPSSLTSLDISALSFTPVLPIGPTRRGGLNG
jgi:hypothetical protein